MQTKNCPNNASTIQSYLKFIAMLLAIWLLALPVDASNKEAATQEDLSSQKEIFQLKLDARNDKIDALNKRLDDQIARTSDIGSGVDRLGVSITAFGVLLTVVLFISGLIGYFSTVSRAKREAQEAAKNWFDENSEKLKAKIVDLEKQADEGKGKIATTVQDVQVHGSVAHDAIYRAQDTIGSKKTISEADKAVISAQAVQLEDKAESQYSYDDWNTRAFAAYENQKLEEAAVYWDKASQIQSVEAAKAATAMLNKGFTLGQLNRNEDAIAVYDALIAKFGDSKEVAVLEQIAKAIVNKGNTLGQLNCSEDAIAVYDALIAKFSDSKEAAMLEQVAKAMANKGNTLGQLNRNEDAIAVYDALIAKFGGSKEAAAAMNGKGFISLIAAKEGWSDEVGRTKQLLHASKLFADAFERNPNSATTIGNQSYAAWLQGMPVMAEEKFKVALTATVDGGETIYKGTLADLEMHSVDLDAGFKALIERLWREYTSGKAVD